MISRTSSTSACVSHSLLRKLNAYALAASAAGVGAIATAQSAEAKILYTPTHKTIPLHHHIAIDINHDGIDDMRFANSSKTFDNRTSVTWVGVYPLGKRDGVAAVGRSREVAAIRAGAKVGYSRRFIRFGQSTLFMADRRSEGRGYPSYFGRWWNDGNGEKNHYLGFQITVKGKLHYGWARMNVTVKKGKDPFTVVLTGYAYETVADKAITTGKTKGPDVMTVQPGTLGHLALGRK